MFFDNLQVIHTRGPILEETHYYPFGLTMAGISSKALNNAPENKYKYNGIELNNDFDLNVYDARYRNLDPQIGRFWQIDPKIESFEALSPYAAMMNNPIRYSDPLGDSTIPGAGFLRNLWEGVKDGGRDTKNFIRSLGTTEGWKNLATGVAATVDMVNGSSPEAVMQRAQVGGKIVEGVQNIPNMSSDELGHAAGYGAEKVGEAVLLSKGAGMVKNAVVGVEATGIANPIPGQLARVVPNSAGEITTLGRPGATEAFVTASADIKGMNASQIAARLTIPESNTGFKVIEFKTPYGIATPINRNIPGFVGGGRTAGGAREFVVPNQPIPANAKVKIVN